MKTFVRFCLMLSIALCLRAQTVTCNFSGSLSTTTPGAAFDNRVLNCNQFVVTYTVSGFTAMMTVFEGAPDVAGSPGTYTTLTATVGLNPNTSLSNQTMIFNNVSSYWLRMRMMLVNGGGPLLYTARGTGPALTPSLPYVFTGPVLFNSAASLVTPTFFSMGGTTASFPAFNVNTTFVETKLADNSAFTGLRTLALSVADGVGNQLVVDLTNGVGLPSTLPVKWSSGINGGSTIDTGLSRTGPNQIGVGNGTAGDFSGSIALSKIFTNNCASSASPAVCGATASGSVALSAGATTLVVNTTLAAVGSQIQLTFDSSLGTRLSVTCNTTPVQPTVSARVAGASFTISVPSAPVTNPACFSYSIIN